MGVYRSPQKKAEAILSTGPAHQTPPPHRADTTAEEDEEEQLNGFESALMYAILLFICILAFSIRLISVVRYESIIHEYDPYFNFRATKVLANEGFFEFLNWFDDRSW